MTGVCRKYTHACSQGLPRHDWVV